MKTYKIPISVLVVIYTPDLKVLLLERTDRPGFWQSVTGSQDAGETLHQTAIRELLEETGLNAEEHLITDWETQNVYEIYPIWRHRYAPGITQNTEHVFGLMVPRPLPIAVAPREHVQYEWLDSQAAAKKVFSWSNRDAILRLPDRVQR
ncbi:MAG: dihydroneopterin triphosphate diphosphatase [Burkholderiales bacterium]